MGSDTKDFQDTYLRFVSSELTSHAANIIGFSIMLFAYLNVISQYFPKRVPLQPPFCLSSTTIAYIIIFGIFWLINAGIFFAFMRLALYGAIANSVIRFENSVDSLRQLQEKTDKKIKGSKFLGIIPLEWFSRGIAITSRGFYLSLAFGFFISIIFFFTFLFSL